MSLILDFEDSLFQKFMETQDLELKLPLHSSLEKGLETPMGTPNRLKKSQSLTDLSRRPMRTSSLTDRISRLFVKDQQKKSIVDMSPGLLSLVGSHS